MKQRLRYIGLLLLPSTLSLILTLVATGLLAGSAFWVYGLRNGLWYEYLFGPSSALTALQQQQDLFSTVRHTIFSNDTFNKILYYVMWLVLGLIVYEIVMAIRVVVGTTINTVEEERYVHSGPQTLLRRVGPKLAIRTLVAGCWIIYSVFFLKLLLPFSLLSFKIGAGQLGTLTAWLYGSIGMVVLLLSLHIHTIFLRLFALRVRFSDVAGEALLDSRNNTAT